MEEFREKSGISHLLIVGVIVALIIGFFIGRYDFQGSGVEVLQDENGSEIPISNSSGGGEIKNTGTSRGISSPPLETKEVVVSYSNSGFSPFSVIISQGDEIIFINNSSAAMRVTSDTHPHDRDYPELRQAQSVGRGEKYVFTVTRVGAWGYHNENNISHSGTIIIKPQGL